MQLTKNSLRAGLLGVGVALSLGGAVGTAAAETPTATFDPAAVVSPLNTGYDVTVCGAPSTGIAIRAGDSNGTTELGRVYNGSIAHVYATHASSPSISPGWATGYGHEPGGHVVHGYFNLAYTC
jgi:hypothetical protein